jgi:Na+/melibiose symporter-like transporter
MNSKKWETSKGERMSFGLFSLGTILSYYMIMSYLQLYMTDIAIPAVTVGIIFMAAKIWDAINDPLFGVIVDRINLKNGKYKPWVRLATIAISMFGLAAVGFVEGSGVMQPPATIQGIWTLYALFPMIGTVSSLALFTTLYKLRDNDVRIMIRFNNGEISREEAERSFAKSPGNP